MKIFSMIATSIALLLAMPAQAGVIPHADVNGMETFKDTDTNLVWIKLPEMFGKSYSDQKAAATAAGFTVADFDSVNALVHGSAQVSSGNWASVAAIIGDSSSRDLMWGNYAASETNAASAGYFYAYGNSVNWLHYVTGSSAAYSDLGLWAYQVEAAAVPEPVSLALIGLGLLGVAASRTKRRQA